MDSGKTGNHGVLVLRLVKEGSDIDNENAFLQDMEDNIAKEIVVRLRTATWALHVVVHWRNGQVCHFTACSEG